MGKPFKRTQPPQNQNFAGGISIEMDTYDATGKTGHVIARFPDGCGEQLAAFYQENRKPEKMRKKKEKTNKQAYKVKARNKKPELKMPKEK